MNRYLHQMRPHVRVATALAVITGAAFAAGVVGAAYAAGDATPPTSTVRVLSGWSDPVDPGTPSRRARARFRVLNIDGQCFVHMLPGAGPADLAPTPCP